MSTNVIEDAPAATDDVERTVEAASDSPFILDEKGVPRHKLTGEPLYAFFGA
ncbi:MAG TPA: hypothetical protein VHO23_01075 [Candidatus Paceibacterota bacterium]|nr:hypothetical protein [Candidatus Paceibacterota bacterium]